MAMHLTMVLARGSPGHFCQFCPLHALPLSFSPKSLESDVTKMMSEMLTRSSVQMVVRMRVLMILLVAKLAKRLKTMQTRPSRKPSGSTMLTLRAFALWCVSFLSIQVGVVERCLGDVATQAIANLSNLAIFCKNGTCDQAFVLRNPGRLYVYVINESSILILLYSNISYKLYIQTCKNASEISYCCLSYLPYGSLCTAAKRFFVPQGSLVQCYIVT